MITLTLSVFLFSIISLDEVIVAWENRLFGLRNRGEAWENEILSHPGHTLLAFMTIDVYQHTSMLLMRKYYYAFEHQGVENYF